MLNEILPEIKLFIAAHRSLVIGGAIGAIIGLFVLYEIICLFISILLNAIDKETSRTFAEKNVIFVEELRPYLEKLENRIHGLIYGTMEDLSVRMLPSHSARSAPSALNYLGGTICILAVAVCFILNLIFAVLPSGSESSFLSRASGISLISSISKEFAGLGFFDHLLFAAYLGFVLVILRYVFFVIANLCWRGWNYPDGFSAAAPALISFLEFLPVGTFLLRILLLPQKLLMKHSILSSAAEILQKESHSKMALSAVLLLILCLVLLYFASNGIRAFLPVFLLPFVVTIAVFFVPVTFLKIPALLIGIILFVFIVFRELFLTTAED